ncbi:hypothetical protein DPMN_038917 [Dreissena polymorpha]|uniref:Uncharacterized protein n=1 Tax=Dreissena polymorpha TaxID=45954 RepID=A0A9D4MGE8_DREPO|nr:hypothetical protein DPMN_038917 [Dreissena polymorpha]
MPDHPASRRSAAPLLRLCIESADPRSGGDVMLRQVIKTSLCTCVGAKQCPHCVVYGLLVVTYHHTDVRWDVSL